MPSTHKINNRDRLTGVLARGTQAVSHAFALLCNFIGEQAISRFEGVSSILAIMVATFQLAIRPASWSESVRTVFSRQLLFTGADAVSVSLRIGAAVGVLIIVQAALWIDALGVTNELIEPILWRGIIRELAPLLACLVVIGRSGIAISTELATMVVSGEIEVLDSQGVDPMTYLVMPRILAFVVSVFGLATIIATTMLVTGFMIGQIMGVIRTPWSDFLGGAIRQYSSLDLVFFVPKTTIAGAFAGVICCRDGMSVRGTISDVPRVTARSGIRALTAVFAVSAVLSVLIYGRFLVFKVL
jgi:phospholipid/cholesterol/gamma-HCH transport system permease protein